MGIPLSTVRAFQNLITAQGPTGATGATGAAGAIGATGQGFNLRGSWSSTTAYAALDVVLTGTAPSQQVFTCVVPHTSGASFDATKFAPGNVQGPAGMAVMVWNGTAYVKASDGTTGRPSTGSFPGGTIFYIGPNTPADAVTNDPWFNYSTA